MSEEQVEQQEETEAQDERPVPGTAEPSQAPPEDDRLLRLAADFENYKKRAARERQEYVQLANERLIAELIPILDDLERALAAAEEHQEAQLEEGVELGGRGFGARRRPEGLQARRACRPARPGRGRRAARAGGARGRCLSRSTTRSA